MEQVNQTGEGPVNPVQFFVDRIEATIAADRARSYEHNWSFKERTVRDHTIGDLISTVCGITDPNDAQRFYAGYVAWIESLPATARSEGYTAEQVARSNIGWCFGEGMDGDRIAMWNRVTGASHPVFGTVIPDLQAAFEAGLKLGGAQ